MKALKKREAEAAAKPQDTANQRPAGSASRATIVGAESAAQESSSVRSPLAQARVDALKEEQAKVKAEEDSCVGEASARVGTGAGRTRPYAYCSCCGRADICRDSQSTATTQCRRRPRRGEIHHRFVDGVEPAHFSQIARGIGDIAWLHRTTRRFGGHEYVPAQLLQEAGHRGTRTASRDPAAAAAAVEPPPPAVVEPPMPVVVEPPKEPLEVVRRHRCKSCRRRPARYRAAGPSVRPGEGGLPAEHAPATVQPISSTWSRPRWSSPACSPPVRRPSATAARRSDRTRRAS